MSAAAILCPLCRLALEREPKTWHCANGHSFDVAREGYVNLLPVQHKNSLEPGDDPKMVTARREFLQAGHYGPLLDAVLEMLAPLSPRSLLDVGCGEGSYTGAFGAVAGQVIGLDIAKPAIRLAARRFPGHLWIVGSGTQIPVGTADVDAVCNLFTQLHVSELARVLKPEGHLLVVTPAPDHLWSLREQLFDEVRPHDPDKFLGALDAAFELQARREVRFALELAQSGLRQLLQMTPYAWKARPERRAALEASEMFATQASFTLMLFRRRADAIIDVAPVAEAAIAVDETAVPEPAAEARDWPETPEVPEPSNPWTRARKKKWPAAS
jgi:23S rRNA (guanine745-N1)-methyltransferase